MTAPVLEKMFFLRTLTVLQMRAGVSRATLTRHLNWPYMNAK